MKEHEVYPNAPVVLVALEMRHTEVESLTPTEVRAVKARLSKYVPIPRNAQIASQLIVPGQPTQANVEQYGRFINRENTIAVSFRREAITVEATKYPGWDEFREIVSAAFEARIAVSPPDGVVRLGLRYINEIRVPAEGEIDWSKWINSSILGPSSTEQIPLPLTQWQGIAVYGRQPGHAMVVRYGLSEGFAVDPNSELRRTRPADGPFFLMDIDSFWLPEGPIPELEDDALIGTCDELHGPVRTLFEGLITDKLRDEVLRRAD
jgi:uncharacterized protein (TIGR04255 family)